MKIAVNTRIIMMVAGVIYTFVFSCAVGPTMELSERIGGLTIIKAEVDGEIIEDGLDSYYGPVITSMSMPEYPKKLQDNGGKVLVKVIMEVGTNGFVRDVIIVDSPDKRFNKSAIKCAHTFTFDPGRDSENKAIKTWVNFSFYFVPGM